MICPFCGNIKTSVSNTRLTHQGSKVWRRRFCEECGRTFTTRENVELGFLGVTKSNGSNEPFIRTKLIYSVIRACDHLPDTVDTSMNLVETIERQILTSLDGGSSIDTSVIAEITAGVLKRFNPLAHLKYVGHRGVSTDRRTLKQLIKESSDLKSLPG